MKLLKLDTLIKVLLANNGTDLIIHALRIEKSMIKAPEKLPETLVVEVYRGILPKGLGFKGGASYGFVECKVLSYSIYRLGSPYEILLPNGDTDYVRPLNINTEIMLTPFVKINDTIEKGE